MITALDHFVLICPDIATGTETYRKMLGLAPSWRSENPEDGTASAIFRVENTALELIAPKGEGPVGARLSQMLSETGPKLTSLAFLSDDLDADHHLLQRRGLAPGEISSSMSQDVDGRGLRRSRRFRCPDALCGGVKTFIINHGASKDIGMAPALQKNAVHALDHLVIRTDQPDRAAALYGARLGLRLALDRTAEEWKTRFLFFRTGGLTLEVVQRLDEGEAPTQNDQIWGLTWAVKDLEGAHDRLREQGNEVSAIRKGRKPGSRVFTLRDGTLGIPTLFITHEAS